jgi:hypothetical protein
MRILAIGDVVGKPGRRAVAALLPALRDELRLDAVIANGENAAAGRGLTERTARDLFDAGVDVLTSGNHIWDQAEIIPVLDKDTRIIRPANYPAAAPGRGMTTLAVGNGELTVINLMGRTFMYEIDDPFARADELLADAPVGAPIVVDMHGEATSEKVAMAWHLDGRVAAVFGTHTHVPTADQRIFPRGTAFVCDLGMCGVRDSIIGVEVAPVMRKFLTGMPARFKVPDKHGAVQFNSVLVDIDDTSRCARSIERVDREWTPEENE